MKKQSITRYTIYYPIKRDAYKTNYMKCSLFLFQHEIVVKKLILSKTQPIQSELIAHWLINLQVGQTKNIRTRPQQ